MFLTDVKRWKAKRAEYLNAARSCRSVLTDPNGYWKLSADSKRVQEAVGEWVNKARNAHAFALGRKPVIPNFIFINNHGAVSAPLYAEGL